MVSPYPNVSTLHDACDSITTIARPLPPVLDELALQNGAKLGTRRGLRDS